MAKYVHTKGLERQQLRNYSRPLQVKVRNLIKGQEVELSDDDIKDFSLASCVKKVNETTVTKKSKYKGGVENGK